MACFSGRGMYSHFPKKFIVGDVHSYIEHKLHIMMMMMIAAKYSVEEDIATQRNSQVQLVSLPAPTLYAFVDTGVTGCPSWPLPTLAFPGMSRI